MELKHKYLILETNDLKESLTEEELVLFKSLINTIDEYRDSVGKTAVERAMLDFKEPIAEASVPKTHQWFFNLEVMTYSDENLVGVGDHAELLAVNGGVDAEDDLYKVSKAIRRQLEKTMADRVDFADYSSVNIKSITKIK